MTYTLLLLQWSGNISSFLPQVNLFYVWEWGQPSFLQVLTVIFVFHDSNCLFPSIQTIAPYLMYVPWALFCLLPVTQILQWRFGHRNLWGPSALSTTNELYTLLHIFVHLLHLPPGFPYCWLNNAGPVCMPFVVQKVDSQSKNRLLV